MRARPQNDGNEAAVYKDQLAEIDRDVAAGLIGTSEAEAARVEISRRLLAAADHQRDPPVPSNIGLRRVGGRSSRWSDCRSWRLRSIFRSARHSLPIFRWPERTRAPDATQPLDNLVAQVEEHLEQNPTDGRGWNVLAPVLARLGRYDERFAPTAIRSPIMATARARRADLGEAIAGAAGGVVTSEAKAEFERALALNADEARRATSWARRRAGRPQRGAAAIWRAMLAKAPPDAPWRPLVQAALARVGGPAAPALSDDTVAAAKDMNEADRNAMIHGMVDRLATRLKQNGDDVEGWLRLVRAYMVMGDRDKAKGALTRCPSGRRQRCRAAAATERGPEKSRARWMT